MGTDDDDDDDNDDLMPSKKLDEKEKYRTYGTGKKELKLEHSVNLERVHAHFFFFLKVSLIKLNECRYVCTYLAYNNI